MPRTDPAECWGIRVAGQIPYLAYEVFQSKEAAQAACTESFHRPVRVTIVPRATARAAGIRECVSMNS